VNSHSASSTNMHKNYVAVLDLLFTSRYVNIKRTYTCALSGSFRRHVISCCILGSIKISRILLSDNISLTLASSRSTSAVACCLVTWQESEIEMSAISSGGWTCTSLMPAGVVVLDEDICLFPSELKCSPDDKYTISINITQNTHAIVHRDLN